MAIVTAQDLLDWSARQPALSADEAAAALAPHVPIIRSIINTQKLLEEYAHADRDRRGVEAARKS